MATNNINICTLVHTSWEQLCYEGCGTQRTHNHSAVSFQGIYTHRVTLVIDRKGDTYWSELLTHIPDASMKQWPVRKMVFHLKNTPLCVLQIPETKPCWFLLCLGFLNEGSVLCELQKFFCHTFNMKFPAISTILIMGVQIALILRAIYVCMYMVISGLIRLVKAKLGQGFFLLPLSC